MIRFSTAATASGHLLGGSGPVINVAETLPQGDVQPDVPTNGGGNFELSSALGVLQIGQTYQYSITVSPHSDTTGPSGNYHLGDGGVSPAQRIVSTSSGSESGTFVAQTTDLYFRANSGGLKANITILVHV